MANYKTSLSVLKRAREKLPDKIIKSGLMVGLGETFEDVLKTIDELKSIGVDVITIGQYLMPSKNSYPVQFYVEPHKFKQWEEYGKSINITVFAGPLVRSSYNAGKLLGNDPSRRNCG